MMNVCLETDIKILVVNISIGNDIYIYIYEQESLWLEYLKWPWDFIHLIDTTHEHILAPLVPLLSQQQWWKEWNCKSQERVKNKW